MTDDVHRSRLSPLLMEILQIMKFFFKQDRLDFTNGLIPTEEQMLADEDNLRGENMESSRLEMLTLFKEGRIDELSDFLHDSFTRESPQNDT